VRAGIINYCLNKFCPLFIISFLLFNKIGFATWEPYVIIGFIFYIDKFSFRTGYSLAYCESHGINLNDGSK